MKKNIVVWLVALALLLTALPVYASAASIEIKVTPSASSVNLGDTVEYVVTATGTDVVAMQFEIKSTEGLSYVPNSGATPKDLAKKLGVPAADWTEISKMFTFYNDIGITMKKGTELLRFSCKAEKVGTHAITIYELLPYDSNFEYFEPKVTIGTVTVRNAQDQLATLPPATEPPVTQPIPTLPPATEPVVTEPAVTEPVTTVPAVTEDPNMEEVTEILDPTEDVLPTEDVTDPTVIVEEPTVTDEELPTLEQGSEESATEAPNNGEIAEENGSSAAIWIILGVVVVAAAAAAIVLIKKKRQV